MNSTAIATDRIFNFSAGPATLPESVLEQIKCDCWNIFDSGIGIMEHSHRGKVFERVLDEAEASCRKLGNIPDDYAVLFLQGGATTQFGMIPANFLTNETTADYANTGVWTTKAIADAKVFGNVNVAFDGESSSFDHVPTQDELALSDNAAYFHYCSNNTIFGTRFTQPPKTNAPIIVDASSEMFGRPINVSDYAMIYAGAQKNLGPSGAALIIIRKDFAKTGNPNVMSMMNYQKHIEAGSRLNTPNTFAIYVMGQVFNWILQQGGTAEMEKHNDAKAKIIYDVIDQHTEFYTGHSQIECRSPMNVTFRTPNPELDAKFIAGAAAHRMDGLKGHRKTGGVRASIYNAFPVAGCEALASYMQDFAAANG